MKTISYKSTLLKVLSLSVLVLTGCNQHTHNYIEHSAKAATCTTNGNKLYYSCEECKKYFDSDKQTEIEENSWVIPSLGHNYKLSYSGDYKSSYYPKETFDATNLVVKEVCQRQDCNKENVITDYTITYKDNRNNFEVGDTKVTIKSNNLSVDVPVSISLKSNTITGLKDEYSVKCKEGISLEGVSATKGNVSISYYLDEQLTNEIQVDDLIGDKTYYASVVSDGLDGDYEIARKSTTIKVTHDYQEMSNQDVIGYKNDVCKICEEAKQSKSIMTSDDINIVDKNSYGMNASLLSSETTEGVNKAGCPLFGTDKEDRVTVTSYLPKINYTLYSRVVMTFKSNGDTWNKSQIGFGALESCDLLDYVIRGQFPTFVMEITYDETQEALNLKLCDTTGSTGKVIIDNPNVIKGELGLPLLIDVAMYRYVALDKILLDHTCSSSESKVSRTDLIGKKAMPCDECGLLFESDELMSDKDFSLTMSNNFGATNWNEIGNLPGWEPAGTEARNCLIGTLQTDLNKTVTLPKIDYSSYEKVEFEIRTTSTLENYLGFGINTNNDLIPYENHTNNEYGLITVICGDDNKTLTISYQSRSGELNKTVTFENASVAKGEAGLPLLVTQNVGAYRAFSIARFAFDHYEHDSLGYYSPSDVIGYKNACCSTCGKLSSDKSNAVMEDNDINIKTCLYGANLQTDETASNVYIKAIDGYILYSMGVSGKANTEYKLNLPKVNYSLYSKVTMTVKIPSGWFRFGLDETNSVTSTKDGTTAMLVIEQNQGVFNVSLVWTVDSDSSSIGSYSEVISDQKIISGEDSLSLYAKDPYGNPDRLVRITKIEVIKAN